LAVFTFVLEKMWFQEITPCCERLLKFAPIPGDFPTWKSSPLLGENPFSSPIE